MLTRNRRWELSHRSSFMGARLTSMPSRMRPSRGSAYASCLSSSTRTFALSAEEQTSCWTAWISRGPDGPIEDEGEPELALIARLLGPSAGESPLSTQARGPRLGGRFFFFRRPMASPALMSPSLNGSALSSAPLPRPLDRGRLPEARWLEIRAAAFFWTSWGSSRRRERSQTCSQGVRIVG